MGKSDKKIMDKSNLLIITQKVDINDDLLGFMHGWIIEFAKHCEKVTVICLGKGEYHLPDNVKVLSLGKENYKLLNCCIIKLLYCVNFYKYIWQERKNYDSVFVHMNKEYVWLGSLLWKPMEKKIIFWYAHYKTELPAKIALLLSDKIVTSVPLACKYKSKKLSVIGQGINIEYFRNLKYEKKESKINLLYLGRISRVKNLKTLIRALAIVKEKNNNVFLNIVGGVDPDDKEYFSEVKTLVDKLNLSDHLKFWGKAGNREVLDFYNKNDIYINLTKTGSFDKTTLEAMACEKPVIVSNQVFKNIFPTAWQSILIFKEENAEDLAEKIINIINLPEDKKNEVRKLSRSIIIENHSVNQLVEKIIFYTHEKQN